MTVPPQILQPSEPGWLASLLPVVLGLSVSASYAYKFQGSSFVTTSDGCLITADHVSEELDKTWQENKYAPPSGRATPGALYIPADPPFLIPIRNFRSVPNDVGGFTDLAVAQLALPAGPQDSLRQMQSLAFSSELVKVGDEVTMVGYLHRGESVDESEVDESENVITTWGVLTAVRTTVVTQTHVAIPVVPAPVFEMPCRMPGGFSGGPIFRTGTNEVVGVCSRAPVDDEIEPYCFGSTIQPLLRWLENAEE